eukprot:jgi/Orpsp1_1/1176657/evm.model.c7180000058460.2
MSEIEYIALDDSDESDSESFEESENEANQENINELNNEEDEYKTASKRKWEE